MRLKSLLSAAVVMCASATAFAEFPSVNVYPAEGVLDNTYMLGNFNLSSSGEISVAEDAKMPRIESLQDGSQYIATNFSEFYGSIIINFDSNEFTENGEYELIVPAGALVDADGNKSPMLSWLYELNDPNLNLGDFPEITLESSNPANDAALMYWGESLGKVSFVTSDDDAVNYIEWYLFDITDVENPSSVPDFTKGEYIRQGNENRIDVNRTFGDASDQWANGLFINVGGSDHKMLKGHTYRLYLTFAGIGYDPETNQYPTPQQIKLSTELETYLDFTGLIAPTEYSPYEVETIMPDPAEYEFDNLDMRTFTVVYTGPVKPTMFTYPLGMGAGAAPAGTYEPEDADEAGYAKVWNFTFDEDVLKTALGEIMVTIEAVDADGLPVKGNGGFATDDFGYKIQWKANAGADKLVSVSPEDGEIVDSLSSITVSNEAARAMFLSYNTMERPRIISMGRAGIAIDLDEPTFSDDETQATWTFDEITEPGNYALIIPKYYFNVGTEFESTTINQTRFTYTIEGETPPPGDVVEDLEPVKVSLEDGAELDEPLESIVLTFADVTFISFEPMVPGILYRVLDNDETEIVEEVEPVDNDFFAPTEYTYTFANPVSENGQYKFVIAARAFFDETYDMSEGTEGHCTPELVYNFTMNDHNAVEGILASGAVANVYDIAGRVVVRNANAAQIKALAAGMYIINGKKYVVK